MDQPQPPLPPEPPSPWRNVLASFMRHRHMRGKPDEWIHVHRPSGGGGGGPDLGPWIKCAMYAIMGLIAWEILKWVIGVVTSVVSALFPFIIVGGVVLFVLNIARR